MDRKCSLCISKQLFPEEITLACICLFYEKASNKILYVFIYCSTCTKVNMSYLQCFLSFFLLYHLSGILALSVNTLAAENKGVTAVPHPEPANYYLCSVEELFHVIRMCIFQRKFYNQDIFITAQTNLSITKPRNASDTKDYKMTKRARGRAGPYYSVHDNTGTMLGKKIKKIRKENIAIEYG